MELGPKNPNGDGLLGPNSMMVVYMGPLGTLLSFYGLGIAAEGALVPPFTRSLIP